MLKNRFGDTATDYFELEGKLDQLLICSFCGKSLNKQIDSIDEHGTSHKWFCSCASAVEQIKTNDEVIALQKQIDKLKQKIEEKKNNFYKRNPNFIDTHVTADATIRLQVINDV
jgi:hypothetical protein